MAGAQAGKTVVENNALSLPSRMMSYGQAAASWNHYAETNGLSAEEKQAGLDKIAKGDLPEGANITKAIVEGYQDGVMIAGAWYLGPAATAGKVIGGGVLGLTANGGYQYYDLSKPGNEGKSWDYLGSATSFTMGTLAPGRGIWANTGIAMGGAVFTDGPNGAAIAGAGLSAWSGGTFGKFGPFSSEVNDIFGAFGGEFISNKVKDAGKKE
ncbi:adhesin [Enterobacter sp. RIT418]|nr:adhesin [Enterobacter sp. RIT 418]